VTSLFVALSQALVPPEALVPELEAHLDYMRSLEARGLLFASGPFLAPDGGLSGNGLTIVRAGSFDEARALLERDPFVVAGLRTFALHAWEIREGRP
jgi:uncharacterized protein YciI